MMTYIKSFIDYIHYNRLINLRTHANYFNNTYSTSFKDYGTFAKMYYTLIQYFMLAASCYIIKIHLQELLCRFPKFVNLAMNHDIFCFFLYHVDNC